MKYSPSPCNAYADAAKDEAEDEPSSQPCCVVLVCADEATRLHAEVAEEHGGEAAENAFGIICSAIIHAARGKHSLGRRGEKVRGEEGDSYRIVVEAVL